MHILRRRKREGREGIGVVVEGAGEEEEGRVGPRRRRTGVVV